MLENVKTRTMKTKRIVLILLLITLILRLFWGCKAPEVSLKEAQVTLPEQFNEFTDSTSQSTIPWRDYFDDEQLNNLIDTALVKNQEINIVLQELTVSKNEVLEKQGELIPKVKTGLGLGIDKVGRYTRNGAVEENLNIAEDKRFPEPLGELAIGAMASWEVDIWHKLHNAKDAAQMRYLAQTEGRHFLVTQLISEIAEQYYEYMALSNLLRIIDQNVTIQQNALDKVKILKQYAKSNQLAVNRFQAQLIDTQNQKFAIQQKMIQVENRLKVLIGDYNVDLKANQPDILTLSVDQIQAGLPSDLLNNRPDIRQAEYALQAANLDVKVAKANFYPSLELKAGLGFNAFNPKYIFDPASLAYDTAGDLMAPIINRKAIKAQYNTATAIQIQSVFNYEQKLLQAYTDVLNQLGKLDNYSQSVLAKSQEVDVLNKSVDVANSLFQYAKADYVEVLLTQEEVLDAQMELVETKLDQLKAKVQIYRALGGGWQ